VFPPAINQALTDAQKYDSVQRPRKRLLSKIYTFREEVNIVKKVMFQQQVLFFDYTEVLLPETFRITNNTRKSMYFHEICYFNHFLNPDHKAQRKRIEALEDRIDTLVRETNQQVDILEEDHGKAILVFTIVTIIFLPLSFVTGLLGANTVDIRGTIGGQWHFWAIALPVSTIVVALSLLIGYRSDDFQKFLEESISKLKSRSMISDTLFDQHDEPDEESNVSAEEETTERVKAKPQNRHRKARKIGLSVGGDNV
jgi:Mg2+ and Co2+ transporter CorA